MDREEAQNELANIILECDNTLETMARSHNLTPIAKETKETLIHLISVANKLHDAILSEEPLSERQKHGNMEMIGRMKESLLLLQGEAHRNMSEDTKDDRQIAEEETGG